VLSNYQGYDGETIPALERLKRREPTDAQERRYRGHWLVIDEFTRAQIDAAFGSLLTTLGGQRAPTLAVPTEDGGEQHVPLPRDFRLIGTLNSFDRHFLNQMSEAMKRRFAFIDILPPGRAAAEQEQARQCHRAPRPAPA
jgi:MoxR-like ATPase